MIGFHAFSQWPSKLINWAPSYPLAVGERTVGDLCFSSNGLHLHDIELDSLPQYEIGQILEQWVSYTEEGYGFYVKADSLHSLNVVYSCEVSNPPKGSINFNKTTGRFKYYPAFDDYRQFVVTFSASNGNESITENVVFNPMPQTKSEAEVFYSKGTMPDAGDYITIAETSTTMYLNTEERPAYSISIAGKDIVFEDAVKNKVWGLNGREDIYNLNIYAERLIIRSALHFPATNITIYAREIIFEDKKGVASINTTPKSIETLADGKGHNGENAGIIRLYIKDFKSNPNIRFILNGGKGQSTNRNGTPGGGGNGGTLVSTIDVSSYCDYMRGSGGVKYDVADDGSATTGPVIEYGATGTSGQFYLEDNPYAYLHPYYVAAVIRHANDAFINNYMEYVYQTCTDYHHLIDEYLTSEYTEEGPDEGVHDLGRASNNARVRWNTQNYNNTYDEILEEPIHLWSEFQSDLLEINAMLFKLQQGLDYFGNPAGWVPLLSFEVYLKNFDNEISRAIPTLYMSYWMNRIDRTLQEKVRGSQEAAIQTEKEIDNNRDLLNSLTLEIPILQNKAKEINHQIVDLTTRIERLQNQLMAKAIKKVKKKNWLKKLLGIAKSVVGVIPVVGKVATFVNIASNIADVVDISGKLFKEDFDVTPITSILESVGSNTIDFSKMISDVKDVVNKTSFKDIGTNAHLLKDTYESLSTAINPLTSNITKVYNVLTQNTAPNSEVQAEYNRLIASSPMWNRLKAQVDELNMKKTDLMNHMNDVFSNMTTTLSELSNDALALDAFRRDAFTINSKRDLNAMLYIEKMEQRAKSRLLKYDYYLRKAYEYRLLKPYEGEEFNLVGMFERFEKLALTTDSVINNEAYDALASVYKERVSDMTQRIIEEYTYNQAEKSTTVSIITSKEQLDAINANGSITLNLYEQDFGSVFFPEEDNIRIVNLGIGFVKAHTISNASRSRLSLEMKHSGISQYRKNGKTYWFNHMSRNTDNPHFWRTTIDFSKNAVEKDHPETHQNSVAISSLLSSILNHNMESVMLFSRPSAWSDITLTKQMQTDGDSIVIDSLVLELQYDYTRRSDNTRNIDVTASDGLTPYFACSVEDISGKSGGYGPLYRSYRTSSQSVTFKAQEKYGTYYFAKWTNRNGKVVSDKPELTVSRSTDQYYIAQYERRLPKLGIQDTISVSAEAGSYIVHVKNIGTNDVEMDWYVEDSLSTWVHLNDVTEGMDDGDFTFTYDDNNSNSFRYDSLTISAPETEEMPKVIYIKQDPNSIQSTYEGKNEILVFPNPAKDNVAIKGDELRAVYIYSLSGKMVSSHIYGGANQATINIEMLPAGMYMFIVETKGTVTTKKVLKVN